MDLQMGRELDVNFLFVPAPGSCSVACSQIFEKWILSQPRANTF
jgi:hypothetical protein